MSMMHRSPLDDHGVTDRALHGGVDPSPRASEMLVDYETYAEAQAAVDRLSDQGFPVGGVSIVWHRLRRVEYVTGRRTTMRAFLEGALSGLWFGGVIGVFLTLFVQLDENVSAAGVIVSYALIGALVVAVWRALGHWAQRGRRDFSAIDRLEAERYQLWCEPEGALRAKQLLDLHDARAMDPA